MQTDQLVIAVDAENNGTPANETYTRYEENVNRSSYIGAAHTPDNRDLLALYRTFPTKTGNFKGTSKSAVKFTKDIEVAGVDSTTLITAPIIVEVSFSVPVGALAADLKHCRQRVLALLDSDLTMDKLNIQLMV